MKSRFVTVLIAVCLSTLLFPSCSKSNKQGRYVPASAGMVIHINGESMNAKLPWSEVKQSSLFQSLYNDTSVAAYLKAAMDNPENTGIDIKNDLVIFMQKDSAGGYIAFEGKVKDAVKFKQFHSEMTKSTETEKEGIHFLSNDKSTAAWDKEKFIIVIDAPEMNQVNNMRNPFDSNPAPVKTIVKRDLQSVAAGLFSLKESNSLAKEAKFSELLETKGDLHFWMNTEALYGDAFKGNPSLSMMNLSKMYEGSRMAATANFENGKINVDARSYSGKEMSELWKKYGGEKINSDMVKRIPAKDIAGFMAFNFKPEGIREFVKLLGMEGFANMGSAFLGFNLDEFVKANKGDIVLTVSDIRSDSAGKTEMNILFATSIGDKASFGKLVDAGKKLGSDKFGAAAGNKIFYNNNDAYFAIGNNKANIDQYISSGNNSNFDFFDKMAGSPGGAYINFQYIFNAVKNTAKMDSLDRVIFEASAKMWDNLVAKGGEFKDNAITQHWEINLVDKGTNSLKQLNNYLSVVGTAAQQKKKASNDNWQADWENADSLQTK